MLIKPDCIPCLLRMSISTIRKLPLGEDIVKELFCKILDIPSLRGHIWGITSAEVIELVMEKIISVTDNPDPFYSDKLEQNKRIMELYPYLNKLVQKASDPLNMAVKLAIIGNSIDFMMPDSTIDIAKSIKERLQASISRKTYSKFVKQLKESRLLLYFGDNAGEIVLDKLLIEKIKEVHDTEVVFVVRGAATLNDATLREAKLIGLDKVASVVENGIEGPLPGTILSRCSKEVRNLVDRADLIISKGGGNFDTLEGEKKVLKNHIAFMLLSDCYPYYNYFGNTELYQLYMV